LAILLIENLALDIKAQIIYSFCKNKLAVADIHFSRIINVRIIIAVLSFGIIELSTFVKCKITNKTINEPRKIADIVKGLSHLNFLDNEALIGKTNAHIVVPKIASAMNADLSVVTKGKFPPRNTVKNSQTTNPPTIAPKIADE